jgi:hypothetical protein
MLIGVTRLKHGIRISDVYMLIEWSTIRARVLIQSVGARAEELHIFNFLCDTEASFEFLNDRKVFSEIRLRVGHHFQPGILS